MKYIDKLAQVLGELYNTHDIFMMRKKSKRNCRMASFLSMVDIQGQE
jgi:hypothetical protein